MFSKYIPEKSNIPHATMVQCWCWCDDRNSCNFPMFWSNAFTLSLPYLCCFLRSVLLREDSWIDDGGSNILPRRQLAIYFVLIEFKSPWERPLPMEEEGMAWKSPEAALNKENDRVITSPAQMSGPSKISKHLGFQSVPASTRFASADAEQCWSRL